MKIIRTLLDRQPSWEVSNRALLALASASFVWGVVVGLLVGWLAS